MNYLMYGGKSSREYGIYISGSGTYGAPERDIETIEIPGRNGSLIVDNHRFRDIVVEYPAFIRKDFAQNARAARLWLMASAGYQRLEDTYDYDYYRQARFSGPLDFDTKFLNRSGEMTLSFACKPQRWRKDGDRFHTMIKGGKIYNPFFPSLPLIRVWGGGPGTLSIGQYIVEILNIDEHIMLDCEIQSAYKDTLNKNSAISAPVFPMLEPGYSAISWDGGITGVEIAPRWWTI